MQFHGRQRELAMFDEAYRREGAQLFVMYGRRGVGKTALLGHWLRTRKYRHLFWTADQRSATVLLRLLSQNIATLHKPTQPVAAEFTYASWDMAFDELGRLAETERLVVVLDEFTYLMAADPALPSILQRLWDQALKHTRLMLVLTGSHAGMIERDLLSYRAPLYHRATSSLHLHPLPYGSLVRFFPQYSPEARVELYACLGGVPAYLSMIDPALSWRENLPKLITSQLIINDAGALLRDQLSEPAQYIAITSTIASGFEQFNAIATMAGLPNTQLSKYLGVLRQLDIVVRDVPATETNPDKSKIGRYRVVDPYLRFYYHFLANQRGNLERGLAGGVMQTLNQHLPDFVGANTFEELCRDYVLLLGAAGRLPFVPRTVGSYWAYQPPSKATLTTRPPQIDVVAINEDAHQLILGECKWTGKPMGADQVIHLFEQAEKMIPKPADKWTVTYAFFCRTGFTPEARAVASGRPCLWVDLKQLDTALRKLAQVGGIT